MKFADLKFTLAWALFAVLLLGLCSQVSADDAPPACVGDQCTTQAADAAKSTPQRSVVYSRTYATQFGARRPVLTAPVRVTAKVVRYGLKGGAKLIAAPFRAARAIHNNSLARRASRGNSLAAARLSNKACRGAY